MSAFFGLNLEYKLGLHQEIFSICYAGKGGFTFVFLATRKFLGVELYIDVGDASTNERYFNHLLKCKKNIENEYGAKLHWDPIENKRACRVRHIIRQADVRKSNQMDAIETLIVHMEKFEAAIRPELGKLGDQLHPS